MICHVFVLFRGLDVMLQELFWGLDVTGTVLGTGCYRNCFGYWMLQELFCCLVLSVYPLFPLSDFPFQDSTLRVIC